MLVEYNTDIYLLQTWVSIKTLQLAMQFNFKSTDAETTKHTCIARREGDWAVFTCPLCPGFERRLNLRTGAMQHTPGPDPFALHQGYFVPAGLEHAYSLPN